MITPPTISSAIFAAAPAIKGVQWPSLCSALGIAIHKEIVNPATVSCTGVTTGVAGAGTIPTGKMVFAPLPAMVGFLAANGVKGVVSLQITKACIVGTTNALNSSCEYYGTSAGVGIGSDVSKVVMANPAILIGSLQSCFVAFGFNGVVSKLMAVGVGNGISSILLTGTGAAAVVGSPSPVPSVGVSTCFLR